MKTFAQLADHFEKVLNRLPGPIRTPVEREWKPLKELFVHRRAPRLVIVGPGADAFARAVLCSPPDSLQKGAPGVFEEEGDGWQTFRHRGVLCFATADGEGRSAKNAIASMAPDCFIFLADQAVRSGDLELLQECVQWDRQRHGEAAPIVAVGADPIALDERLQQHEALGHEFGAVRAVLPASRREAILAAIGRILPGEARLEFARVSGEKVVQREIAQALSRSTTAVCTGIGAQPIPLADFPILTSLQVLMVAGIIHVAGREWSLATARDFIAALGVNVGAGLILREGARAAVKLLPGWGNAISGAVAGAGTFAIGRAATAFFIEGLPLDETRRRFRLSRKAKKPKALPPSH